MKYVTAALHHEPAVRHPMHQFVVERDGFDASRLLASTVTEDAVHTALFHVDGWPPDAYQEALADVSTLRAYDLSTHPDETFSLYVREELSDFDEQLTAAFGRAGLAVRLPVVFDADGSVGVRLVGPAEPLQRALDDLPEGISLDVLDIGEYDRRRVDGGRTLTERQYEAVAAALDAGYYGDPREGSVEDVAATLDCARSTAAEHLRRAERKVLERFVSGSDPVASRL
jgi:hypothetical protein